MTVFVYILDFIFMAFLTQKLIYTINIWFNFVLDSFSNKIIILLTLIVLGGYCEKMTQIYTYFKTKTDVAQIWSINF